MSEDRQTDPFKIDNILENIFKFLPVRDRNNAKLVNNFWFEVCSQERFLKEEAFCISYKIIDDVITDVLSNSKRKTLNIKFFKCQFDEGSHTSPLWKTCSTRIESLTFHKCTFHASFIPNIFEICENLIEFHYRFGEFLNNPDDGDALAERSVLLPKKGVVRNKLTTFRMKFDQSNKVELRRDQMERFASAFPALRTLELKMFFRHYAVPFDRSWPGREIRDNAHLPNFSMWVELLATRMTEIETFDIQYHPSFRETHLNPETLTIFEQFNSPKWKNVSLTTSLRSWSTDESLNTILAFKFWTSFTIDCFRRNDSDSLDLVTVARLINVNPQLEKLNIQFIKASISDLKTLFRALITSRLLSIMIGLINCEYTLPKQFISEVGCDLQELPEKNYSVRRLEILNAFVLIGGQEICYSDERRAEFGDRILFQRADELCLFCMEYFKNIRYLNAQPGNPEDIFEHQVNLKQLKMFCRLDFPLQPPLIEVNSLEVLDIRPSVVILFSRYAFPNLKFLFIHDFELGEFGVDCTHKEGGENDCLHCMVEDEATRTTPQVNHTYTFKNISKLIVAHAPNVEFLHATGYPNMQIEDYTAFFESWSRFPKLRHVSMGIKDPYFNALKEDEISHIEEDLKVKMYECAVQCPSLRTVRFETPRLTISLVYLHTSRTIIDDNGNQHTEPSFELIETRSSGQKIFGGIDLKNFYFNKRLNLNYI